MAAEDPGTVIRHFAEAAASLAEEASHLALAVRGPGHDAEVAKRAARQAQEAAEVLAKMAQDGATLESAFSTAAWALSAAAVAITQARGTPVAAPPVTPSA